MANGSSAEAFTSGDQERWQNIRRSSKRWGTGLVKASISSSFTAALQPWAEGRRPGMTMGPWGQHYGARRPGGAVGPQHRYLARCQYLLRQSRFVVHLVPAIRRLAARIFNHRGNYDWGECGADAVLTRMSVQDGSLYRWELPGTGASLPGRMTPRCCVKSGSAEAGAM